MENEFKRYVEAVQEREKEEEKLSIEIAELQKKIDAIRKEHKEEIDKAKALEAAARSALESAVLSSGLSGRHVFDDGSWAERSKDKVAIEILDVQAVLGEEIGRRLITGITIDKDATLAMLRSGKVPGLRSTSSPQFRFHIEKAKKENENE